MNDLQKPIVAQIYRLWQDEAGKQWLNACWYYRPEQTVHRVSKRFYKNEVMKTGQYRDHLVEDIVDRCFVMFHTRFHRGRPRGFPPGKEIYVCEARYNEEKYTFNRIKTWTSCLPDEIREKDYEMDMFDVPRKIKKELTPIAHLLAPDARETDPLPKPNWGAKDAPPIIGGVHIRPRESNVSKFPLFDLYLALASISHLDPTPSMSCNEIVMCLSALSRTRCYGTGLSLRVEVPLESGVQQTDSYHVRLAYPVLAPLSTFLPCTKLFLTHPCPAHKARNTEPLITCLATARFRDKATRRTSED